MSPRPRLLQLTCVFAACASVALACGSDSGKKAANDRFRPTEGGQPNGGAGGDPSSGGSNASAASSSGGTSTGAQAGNSGDAGTPGNGLAGSSGQGDGGHGDRGVENGGGSSAEGGQTGEGGSGGEAGPDLDCDEAMSSVGATLLNGSFELPALASPGWLVIEAGQEPVDFGWSVLSDVDVSRAGWTSGQGLVSAPAKAGLQLLDVVAFGSEGGLQQTVDVVPGESYLLELSYANNPVADPPLPSASATITARVCDDIIFSETLTHGTSTRTDFDWTDYSRTFEATAPVVTLEVVQTVGGGSGGVLLDAVSLTVAP